MKQSVFSIIENKPLTSNVYKMVLSGDTSNYKTGSVRKHQNRRHILRRPISFVTMTKTP